MVARNPAPATHKVGPFDVSNSKNELVLRLEKKGELSLPGCLMFGSTMVVILILGLLSVLHTSQAAKNGVPLESPAQIFAPQINHFGFLWVTSSALMMVLLPLYVVKAYNGALIFTFRRSDDVFLRGGRRVARLRRIEYVSIRETRDPDKRYLYLLNIVYNDGQQMLLHNGYDEREIMNLANEVSSFIGCPVKWKQASL